MRQGCLAPDDEVIEDDIADDVGRRASNTSVVEDGGAQLAGLLQVNGTRTTTLSGG